MSPDLAARCVALIARKVPLTDESASLLAELRRAQAAPDESGDDAAQGALDAARSALWCAGVRSGGIADGVRELAAELSEAEAEAEADRCDRAALLRCSAEAEAERDRLRADLETERRQAGMDLILMEAQRDRLRALLLRALASWKGRHDPALPLDLSLWDEIEEELR